MSSLVEHAGCRFETVSVIGGGWSIDALGPEGRARIPRPRIGINDSCLLLDCEIGLSMDRVWTEKRWAELKLRGREFWTRADALRNIHAHPPWMHVFDHNLASKVVAAEPSGPERRQLNGGNSGVCGINLAMQLRPRRILLWGFDMVTSPLGRTYWYPPYPWSKKTSKPNKTYGLESGPSFETIELTGIAAGVKVINASPPSAIKAFDKVDPWTLLTETT